MHDNMVLFFVLKFFLMLMKLTEESVLKIWTFAWEKVTCIYMYDFFLKAKLIQVTLLYT